MTPQELKNSILQLAIQGRLVEQRPEEGTAEELYRQIQREKAALVKARKIKKEKPLPEITEEEVPFEIPEGWKWCYVGDIFSHNTGKAMNSSAKKVDRNGTIRKFITTSNLYWNSFDFSNVKEMFFSDDEVERCTVTYGDILMCEGGAYYGRTAIWYYNYDICFQNHVHRLRAYTDISREYFYYIFYFYRNTGMMQSKGTAMPGLSSVALHNLIIPVPPLAEQKRIVAKIEELLPYIDRYEVAWSRLEDFNKRFPTDMQKSILQLAIQGKLVPQRPEEGTGEALYQQIQTEKQSLIRSGNLKKEKPLPEITPDEIPFEISEQWRWVRLGEVLVIERGGSPRPIKNYITDSPDGVNWIKIGDTEKGGKYINHTQEKIIPEGLRKSRAVFKGDFLLSNSMSFGRPYILNIDGAIHDGWLVLRPIAEIFDKDYLYYVLSSPMVYYQFCNRVAGAVVNNLNSDKVALTIVPVPPLAEQKRIVAKLEELLPLCKRLR